MTSTPKTRAQRRDDKRTRHIRKGDLLEVTIKIPVDAVEEADDARWLERGGERIERTELLVRAIGTAEAFIPYRQAMRDPVVMHFTKRSHNATMVELKFEKGQAVLCLHRQERFTLARDLTWWKPRSLVHQVLAS